MKYYESDNDAKNVIGFEDIETNNLEEAIGAAQQQYETMVSNSKSEYKKYRDMFYILLLGAAGTIFGLASSSLWFPALFIGLLVVFSYVLLSMIPVLVSRFMSIRFGLICDQIGQTEKKLLLVDALALTLARVELGLSMEEAIIKVSEQDQQIMNLAEKYKKDVQKMFSTSDKLVYNTFVQKLDIKNESK